MTFKESIKHNIQTSLISMTGDMIDEYHRLFTYSSIIKVDSLVFILNNEIQSEIEDELF